MEKERKYKRLTMKEREDISRLLSQGYSQNEIAGRLNRHKSTISREIAGRGFTTKSYRANLAHKRSKKQASSRKKGKKK
ncbi:MAG: helix-turn-helix domain-containing protein [candidate division WOR-3 bacterium]|nr:helix-turn-helix domain-containing protein [candidate division WOR-3 bacterium]